MSGEINREKLKEIAVEGAFTWISDNYNLNGEIRVGVGSGSTVSYSFPRFTEHDELTAIPTSDRTRKELKKRGVRIGSLKNSDSLVFDLDGADEVDPELNLIKGGGGCHYREKKVAKKSRTLAIVVDETKLVDYLGQTFPLPVEVHPESREAVAEKLDAYGKPEIRKSGDELYRTDNENLILDVKLEMKLSADDIEPLEREINRIEGVIENGFFASRRADIVFVGTEEGPKIIRGG
ncbi:ribose-5-phosphate isomerase RpiA [Candidatus Bipolaricaulota bacterium]|nr:ribose-5-phosphate isomerase RpiA [Candidatus Bipolaricaulota bacterium]